MNKARCASFLALSISLTFHSVSSADGATMQNKLPRKQGGEILERLKVFVHQKQDAAPKKQPQSSTTELQEQTKQTPPSQSLLFELHQYLVAQNKHGVQKIVAAGSTAADTKLKALLEKRKQKNTYASIEKNMYPVTRFLAERTVEIVAQSLALFEIMVILKLTHYYMHVVGTNENN